MDEIKILYPDSSIEFQLLNFQFNKDQSKEILSVYNHCYIAFNE